MHWQFNFVEWKHKLSTVIQYSMLRYPQSGRSWLITNSLPPLARFPRCESPGPHHQHRLGTQKACSWAPSHTSWIHIILGADSGWGPKLCSLQKGVVTHGVSHRVGTILGSISKYHLSHTYPCLVNMSVLWEKTSRTECLMRRGAHIHVDVTICGFPFIALARPRNWCLVLAQFSLHLSSLPSSDSFYKYLNIL